MRIKNYIRYVAAGVFAAIYLTGCSQSGTAAEAGKPRESVVQEAAGAAEGQKSAQAAAGQSQEGVQSGEAQEAGQLAAGQESAQKAESQDEAQPVAGQGQEGVQLGKAQEAAQPAAGQEAGAGQEDSAGTGGQAAGSGMQSQLDSDIDRYQEIMDRSGDEGKMVFYFLDLEVGEDAKDKSGDSTVIISPDGKVMLLDAGHPDSGEIVVQALKDLGVEKIDYLVISHPHIDHIGGVPEVMSQFPVEIAYHSYVEYTTQTYYNYVNALKEGGMEVVCLKTGDEFDFGELVKVKVLGPGEDIVYPDGFPNNSTQFLNNNSLLLKFTYGEGTALFGGDLYVSQERDYIDEYGDELKVDVAKANHHGKDTSNLKKWIKTVSPKVVVAMGDELGSMTVYENYVKQGAEYHHTVNDGVVKVIMDDKGDCQVIDQKDSWMN